MKVVMVTCLNERPHVSRIMLECAERLGLDVIASCHHLDDFALIEQYEQKFVWNAENDPAKKWSEAMRAAYWDDEKYTHFLIMGDDDSLSNAGYYRLLDEAENGTDYCGFKRNAYVDVRTGRCAVHEYSYSCDKLIGAGRLISRRAVEAVMFKAEVEMKRDFCSWKQGTKQMLNIDVAKYVVGYHCAKYVTELIYTPIWDVNRRNGLDDYSEKKFVHAGFVPKAVDDELINITDFKLSNNIWNFDILKGLKHASLDECTWFLSEHELNYFNSLT